jgi:hypothetical protein
MAGALTMKIRLIDKITDFGKGIIAGFILAAIIFCLTLGLILHRIKVREIVEYAEKQIELLELQENVINRDPIEFLEVPGVRGAVDNAVADFERRLDEAVYRFRNRLSSRARHAD